MIGSGSPGSSGPARIGLVGCGNISANYLVRLADLPNLELAAVCDLSEEAARRVADEHHVPIRSLEALLADPDIDVVLNLTVPAQHVPVSSAALQAGKHVYQEKPLGLGLAEAADLVTAANRVGRRLGAAPDTVLGTGIQTARHAIDSGRIGLPIAATAFMTSPGHEGWHPNPGFYYAAGGGPLLDMGVYYLTALVTLLGPIESVSGRGSHLRTERIVPPGAPRAGDRLPVEVDTHVTALLTHASGVLSTLVMSFDVQASRLPTIEVYGTDATLAVPDPNQFDGEVGLGVAGEPGFSVLEPSAGYVDAGRGHGLSDMVRAIAQGRPHRQSAELALHVHEVMEGIATSSRSGSSVPVRTTCDRPDAVPYGVSPTEA
ncbi:Gfo/Idh/MocA family protein [Propionibacteriaceae bacterium Y2011]